MPSSTRVPALVVALAAVAVAMSGCASSDDGDGSPPARSAAPTPDDPSLDPPRTGRDGTLITVTGVLAEGVEAGCVLLEAEGRTLLLLGLPRDSAAMGTRVEATGRVRRDVATICQQGVPFQVTSLRRLEPEGPPTR